MKPILLVLTSTFPRWQNDSDPPFVYHLSKRLTKQFDVTVHAPHYPGARTSEIIDGINVHRFRYFIKPLERLAGTTGILPTLKHNKLYYLVVPFFLIAQFCSLFILILKTNPDIIHAHWLFPQGFFAVLMKFFFRISVVVTAHGADIFGLQNKILKKIKRFTVTRADEVTVVSKALRDEMRKISTSSTCLQIIPMGVDSSEFNPLKKDLSIRRKYGIDDLFLLYVGRLSEKKGVTYLVDAMPAVLRRHPDAQLLIIGRGELENKLREQVKILSMDAQVYFTGSVPNTELPAYYATADIFIGPSIETTDGDTEGFGLTFVEASMSGCLVIGAKIGGIRDIIEHGVSGFLVPEKDSQAIADCITHILENRMEADDIRERGRLNCIEQYDWKVITKRYEQLFVETITG